MQHSKYNNEQPVARSPFAPGHKFQAKSIDGAGHRSHHASVLHFRFTISIVWP